jgi:hypothetical protein
MKRLIEVFATLSKQQSYLKNIIILLILSRLMFLEDNQLALIAEIVASLAVIVVGGKNIEES